MAVYDLYRYQLLPAPEFQSDLFEGRALTSGELRSQKNGLFFTALDEISDFSHRRFETTKRILFKSDAVVIFKIGIQKTVDRDISRRRRYCYQDPGIAERDSHFDIGQDH